MPKHPLPAAATGLPKTRPELEALVEAAIARLDEMDGDSDLEPSLGSNFSLAIVGTVWPGNREEESIVRGLDECEEVSEDEAAQCEDEGAVDDDCSDAEDEMSSRELAVELSRAQLGRTDPMAYQKAQQIKTEACQAAVENLRTIQRRQGRQPVQSLRVVGGAIAR